MENFDYGDYIQALLNERRAEVLEDVSSVNLIQIFRINFKHFEEMIAFWKLHKGLAKKLDTNGAKEIKKILLAKGHIKSLEDISDNHVRKYLSDIREEQSLELKAKRTANLPTKKQSTAPASVTPTPENFDSQYSDTSAQVTMADTSKEVVVSPDHQKDWLDASWIGEAPNWNELLTAGSQRPSQGEWNDYWENVWRHLYQAAERHGLNHYEKTTLAGFRRMGADYGSLWLDLNKARRSLQPQYGFNPWGVGIGK